MKKKVCTMCGEEFETSNDSKICFCCTLRDIADECPADEEDFNLAKIQSGTYTDEDLFLMEKERNCISEKGDFDDEQDLEFAEWQMKVRGFNPLRGQPRWGKVKS